jgi:hypothetical protein
MISLWIGEGLRGLRARLAAGPARRAVYWGAAAVTLLMLAINYPRVDLSGNLVTRRYAEAVFRELPADALVVGAWIDITPLQYLQVVEGQRTDVRLFDYGLYALHRRAAMVADGMDEDETWRITDTQIRQVVAEHLAGGHPAFSLSENAILETEFELEPFSRWLYRITPAR